MKNEEIVGTSFLNFYSWVEIFEKQYESIKMNTKKRYWKIHNSAQEQNFKKLVPTIFSFFYRIRPLRPKSDEICGTTYSFKTNFTVLRKTRNESSYGMIGASDKSTVTCSRDVLKSWLAPHLKEKTLIYKFMVIKPGSHSFQATSSRILLFGRYLGLSEKREFGHRNSWIFQIWARILKEDTLGYLNI